MRTALIASVALLLSSCSGPVDDDDFPHTSTAPSSDPTEIVSSPVARTESPASGATINTSPPNEQAAAPVPAQTPISLPALPTQLPSVTVSPSNRLPPSGSLCTVIDRSVARGMFTSLIKASPTSVHGVPGMIDDCDYRDADYHGMSYWVRDLGSDQAARELYVKDAAGYGPKSVPIQLGDQSFEKLSDDVSVALVQQGRYLAGVTAYGPSGYGQALVVDSMKLVAGRL